MSRKPLVVGTIVEHSYSLRAGFDMDKEQKRMDAYWAGLGQKLGAKFRVRRTHVEASRSGPRIISEAIVVEAGLK